MKRQSLIWIYIFISIMVNHKHLEAYPTEVHKRITLNVINQNIEKLNNYLKDVGLPQGVSERVLGKEIRRWIEDGSWQEDINTDILTSHYYNPLTNRGLTKGGLNFGESAYDRANNSLNYWSWKSARENFYRGLTSTINIVREVSLAHTFKALGHTMHLIQDMGVPAHTRDDTHIPYVDGEPYESYTKNNLLNLNYTKVSFPYWHVSISPNAPKQFWDLDSYNGTIAYDSGYIGLSEYSHANFFSKDTILKDFPHPARENTNYYDFGLLPFTVITTPDNINHNTFYISGYGKRHLAALKYFAEDLWGLSILPIKKYQLTLHLDNRCHEEYAQHLIPRAVGYSAGLLDYFFRGKIAVTLPSRGVYAQTENRDEGFKKITLNAQNTSPAGEEMTDGSIELVVKYRLALEDPFQTYPVPTTWEYFFIVVPELNGTRSIPRTNPIQLEFDLSSNPIPIHATDIYLQVVYKGRLGFEQGAVALGSKDISEPTPIDIYNDMDRICINGSWYVAGSPEALALGNQFDFDAYPHHLRNLYIRFSPMTDPKYASPSEYNFSISSLNAGGFFIREVFILSDYQFNYGHRVTLVNADPNDPYIKWFEPRIFSYTGVKNQTEYVVYEREEDCAIYHLGAPCGLYVRYYPIFNSYRGQEIWRGVVFPNASYPRGSSCP